MLTTQILKIFLIYTQCTCTQPTWIEDSSFNLNASYIIHVSLLQCNHIDHYNSKIAVIKLLMKKVPWK